MTETQAPPQDGGSLAVGAVPPGNAATGAPTLSPIELLALGELPPDEAGPLIAQTLESPQPKACGRMYDALGALAWKQSAERLAGEPMRAWHDLYRYAAGLMRDAGEVELGAKLLGIADQTLRWVHYGLARPRKDIRRRAHEYRILVFLDGHEGKKAWREEIKAEFSLKQGNLSRVLANLATGGFVERHAEGRRQLVELTAQGREAINQRPGAGGLVTSPPIEREA